MDNDPSTDRKIVFYGYVRGTHLKPTTHVHLIGVGDYAISDISVLQDPCPAPGSNKDRDNSTTKVRICYYISIFIYEIHDPR